MHFILLLLNVIIRIYSRDAEASPSAVEVSSASAGSDPPRYVLFYYFNRSSVALIKSI